MKFWLKIAAVLAALWLVAALGIWFVRQHRPTAERLAAYIGDGGMAGLSDDARARRIRHVEEMMNGLTFEERQQADRAGFTRRFFRGLTPEEQGAFLDATLPTGFQQLMESFNKMDPVKRKQLVDRAVQQMKEHAGDAPPPGANDQIGQHVVAQGLKSFYSDANADVKLDMAPLIQQMQLNLQEQNFRH